MKNRAIEASSEQRNAHRLSNDRPSVAVSEGCYEFSKYLTGQLSKSPSECERILKSRGNNRSESCNSDCSAYEEDDWRCFHLRSSCLMRNDLLNCGHDVELKKRIKSCAF